MVLVRKALAHSGLREVEFGLGCKVQIMCSVGHKKFSCKLITPKNLTLYDTTLMNSNAGEMLTFYQVGVGFRQG